MRIFVVLITVLSLSGAGLSEEPKPVELLVTGLLHGEEVLSEGGADWWGLYITEEGAELRSVTVSIEKAHDAIVDNEGEATGKQILVDTEEQPMMLFKGLPNAKPGPVPTLRTDSRILYPGQQAIFQPTTRASRVLLGNYLIAYGRGEESKWGPVVRDYRMVLYRYFGTDKQEQQTLVERDELAMDANPYAMWVGDLDGDGKLDLLMEMTHHYNLSIPTLFLSTQAKPGELVGLAGRLQMSGC